MKGYILEIFSKGLTNSTSCDDLEDKNNSTQEFAI
jgi:hypothetical protein